jgi:hypothetical protein
MANMLNLTMSDKLMSLNKAFDFSIDIAIKEDGNQNLSKRTTDLLLTNYSFRIKENSKFS